VLVCGSIFQLGGRRRTRREGREGREGKKWEEKEREGENRGREGDRWRGGGKGNGDRGRRIIPYQDIKKKPSYILQERSVLLLCLGSTSGFVLGFTQELTIPTGYNRSYIPQDG